MLKRTVVGIVILCVVAVFLIFAHLPYVMLPVMMLFAVCAVNEIYRAAGLRKNKVFFVLSLVVAMCLCWMSWLLKAWELQFTYAVTVLVLGVSMFSLFMVKEHKIQPTRFVISGIALITVLLITSNVVLLSLENGVLFFALSFVACAATDVFAYLVGSKFGKHQLAPHLSPKKTIEGAVAGLVLTPLFVLAVAFVLQLCNLFHFNYWLLAVYSLLLAVGAEFGDLSMSSLKRLCNIKDFGKLLPGHGGLLDRFDSQIVCSAYTLVFVLMFGNLIIL
ncbi:MAG: phosphatidate cytidylyltransferase [Clostridia bacterium]|nr:phosphatidate cytidylyltransferase [Clostridia bacterium]